MGSSMASLGTRRRCVDARSGSEAVGTPSCSPWARGLLSPGCWRRSLLQQQRRRRHEHNGTGAARMRGRRGTHWKLKSIGRVVVRRWLPVCPTRTTRGMQPVAV